MSSKTPLSILLLAFLSVGCADMSAVKNMEVVIQETHSKSAQKVEDPLRLRLTVILPKGNDVNRNALVWFLKNFKLGKFESK
ncbi:MAG TPA: hypothetical protein DD435_00465 [Cyanobacteria bacterium UBA8530]|nr:hypothetical protein [Cyanobacteria bacterium UBA8530]